MHRMRRAPIIYLLLATVPALHGCATGQDDGQTTASSVWIPTAGDAGTAATGGESGTAGSDTSAATSVATSAATTAATGSGGADATGGSSGGGSATGGTAGTSTSAGSATGAAGTQPQDGPYSPCATSQDCPAQGLECLQVGADGFCAPQCGDPSECPMAPAGAAVAPLCFPAPGVTYSLCALGCGGGKPCPAGMVCQAVTGHDTNVYDICV